MVFITKKRLKMILQGVVPIKSFMYIIKFDFTWHNVQNTWTFEWKVSFLFRFPSALLIFWNKMREGGGRKLITSFIKEKPLRPSMYFKTLYLDKAILQSFILKIVLIK